MKHRVVDDYAGVLHLSRVPLRIVSLVPNLTELVWALGGAERLVGVTRYCTQPPEVVAALPKLGGTKDPACDQIIALRPDVVLVSSEENRLEDFEHLRSAGLAVFVSAPTTVEEAARSVERLGVLLALESTARDLARDIRNTRADLLGATARRVRIFCPIWKDPWMSFNRRTFAHDMLFCVGGDNVCGDHEARYPAVDLESVATRQPQVILLPNEPYPFTIGDREALQALRGAASGACRVYPVEGKALFWYGPRTPGALRRFAGLLQASSGA